MVEAQPVVVIDDDRDFREAICEVALRFGARAIGFADGRAAIAHLEKESAPLVFLDLQMPGKDGWQVLWELKHHPTLCKIPVTVMSAAQDQASILSAAGVYAFLQKPVSADDVSAVLRSAGVVGSAR